MCILHMSIITQEEGVSALISAAMKGATEVIVELVKAGASVDMQNKVRACSDVTTLIGSMYRHTHYSHTARVYCIHLTFYKSANIVGNRTH